MQTRSMQTRCDSWNLEDGRVALLKVSLRANRYPPVISHNLENYHRDTTYISGAEACRTVRYSSQAASSH